jgi:hypothetical protein
MGAGWRADRSREIDHCCPDQAYGCIMTRPAGPGKERYFE